MGGAAPAGLEGARSEQVEAAVGLGRLGWEREPGPSHVGHGAGDQGRGSGDKGKRCWDTPGTLETWGVWVGGGCWGP